MRNLRSVQQWLQPGLRVKRWLLLMVFGLLILGIGFAQGYVILFQNKDIPSAISYVTLEFLPPYWRVMVAAIVGFCAMVIGIYELNTTIVQPVVVSQRRHTSWVDIVRQHNRLQKGLRVVAIGGGTGLPSVLRGMKHITNNITAVVTMADDGGSSGRLRREMGVPPPGDLRSNIAALADDEDMMTRLFQYRFAEGGLGGHSFGNLFLTALTEITGDMNTAVAVAGRVLAITGRVIPSTLHHVNLGAYIRLADGKLVQVIGESNIPEMSGTIERVFLDPENVQALPEARQAILSANLIVIGPGSLYTSILPNLLVQGIVPALKASSATIVYVCNIAQQPGETEGYTVAEHVEALEKHIGKNVISTVLANNVFPNRKNEATHYVMLPPEGHPLWEQYHFVLADLTEAEHPWRHDTAKLTAQLLKISESFNGEKHAKIIGRTA